MHTDCLGVVLALQKLSPGELVEEFSSILSETPAFDNQKVMLIMWLLC
jgi:hypothetical protein